MKEILKKYRETIWYVMSCVAGLVVFSSCSGAEDLVGAILQPRVEANFGPTSGVAFGGYVLEIFGCWALYRKTHEMSVWVGCVVVVIATAVAFEVAKRQVGG